MIAMRARDGNSDFVLANAKPSVKRSFKSLGLLDLFHLSNETTAVPKEWHTLPASPAMDDFVAIQRQIILKAHKALASVTAANQDQFKDVIEALDPSSDREPAD